MTLEQLAAEWQEQAQVARRGHREAQARIEAWPGPERSEDVRDLLQHYHDRAWYGALAYGHEQDAKDLRTWVGSG